MAVQQATSVKGIDINDIRAGAWTRGEQQERIADDLAAAYEEIAGEKCHSSASSQQATSHDHDGTNGALIRTPLLTWSPAAFLDNRVAPPTAGNYGWAGWGRPIFAVPPGVTDVLVLMLIENPANAESIRVTTIDESQGVIQGPTAMTVVEEDSWLSPNVSGMGALMARMSVNSEEWCQLYCEAWDGEPVDPVGSHASSDDPAPAIHAGRVVHTVLALPIYQAPIAAAPAPSIAGANDTDITTIPSAFPPIDETVVGDDKPWDSWILQTFNGALGLCWELLTNLPFGNRLTKTTDGHNHAAKSTPLADKGADIMHALGSWCYGALRPPNTTGAAGHAGYVAQDTTDPGTNESSVWRGAICAANYYDSGGSHTGAERVAAHRFRMPDATAANATTLGTSKIEVAALIWDDGSGSLFMEIGDVGGTSFGTGVTLSMTGAAALRLVKGTIDAQAVEAEQVLRVNANLSSYKHRGLAICSVGLAYWP